MVWRRRLCYSGLLIVGLLGQLALIARLRDRHLLPANRWTQRLTDRWTQMTRTGEGQQPGALRAPPLEVRADGDTERGVTAGPPVPSRSPDVAISQRPPYLIVILSSSPRSGSSLLGEIMSTPPNSAYFFEPFFYHIRNNMSVAQLPEAAVRDTVRRMLTCQLEHAPELRLAKFRRFIWRQPARVPTPSAAVLAQRCRASSTRVVKLVRPRLAALLPLLQEPPLAPQLRLVHLVRDPRGSINSQLRAGASVWPSVRRNLTSSCAGLGADLAAARGLADPRYVRVHYEELAQRPRQLADQLFRQLRLPLPPSLQAYFDRHMTDPPVQRSRNATRTQSEAERAGAERPRPAEKEAASRQQASSVRVRREAARVKRDAARARRTAGRAKHTAGRPPAAPRSAANRAPPAAGRQKAHAPPKQRAARAPKKPQSQYFSTYRAAGFDPFHWRRELKPETLRQIEEQCGDVIAELERDLAEAAASRPAPYLGAA